MFKRRLLLYRHWKLTLALSALLVLVASSAVDADQVYSWGWNTYGQLGDGTRTNRPSPGIVSNLTGVTGISAGKLNSLALLSDGTVRAWGLHESGFGYRTSPGAIGGLTGVRGISGAGFHSLAVLSDGTVRAWGDNSAGQLGDGTLTTRSTPITVSGLANSTAVSAGLEFSLALLSDRTVRAWGNNGSGQLGTGFDGLDDKRPAPARQLENVTAIAAGQYHSLALRSDGRVYAWGSNLGGLLGGGSGAITEYIPFLIDGLTDVRAIAAGGSHSLAALSDGSVRAWGGNDDGMVGDGTTVNRQFPVTVSGLSNIVAVEAISSSSFALSADGRLWAWGLNQDGQLGLGDTANRLLPTEVFAPTGYRFTAIAGDSFSNHMLAMVAPVPEPSTMVLTVVGLTCVGVMRARRRPRTITATTQASETPVGAGKTGTRHRGQERAIAPENPT